MENHLYVCDYCGTAYVPKKRNYQKYCKPVCRAKAYNRRKKESKIKAENRQITEEANHDIVHEETINGAGIGNAAIGNVIVEGAKHFLTHPDNRPAKKGDLDKLQISLKERYQPVVNVPKNQNGMRPFYDSISKELVYLY